MSVSISPASSAHPDHLRRRSTVLSSEALPVVVSVAGNGSAGQADGIHTSAAFNRPCHMLRGNNFGFGMRGLTVTVAGVDVTRSCAEATELYRAEEAWTSRFTAPALRVGEQCASADCLDVRYQAENRAECAAQTCCHYDFPRDLRDVRSCRCPVAPLPCILSHNHDEVVFRPPEGFGLDLDMGITVSGQSVDGLPFEYQVPKVTKVNERPYNAQGQRIRIEGKNFARPYPVGPLPDHPTLPIAQNISVDVNGLPCEEPAWDPNLNRGIARGLPYINCTTSRDVVGAKPAVVTITDVSGETVVEESLFEAECLPAEWGRPGELCLECPQGAVCGGSYVELRSQAFWWLSLEPTPTTKCPPERQNRTECPVLLPCEPNKACLGNNTCAEGYTADRCSECVKGKYYRLDGECIKCPDNPWILIVGALFAAICVCTAAYILNRKSVNIAHLAILIDYCQVLAIFARSKVEWPPMLKDLFNYLSALNFNLELTAPECSIPDLEYDFKWTCIQLLPIAGGVLLFITYSVVYLYKRCVLRNPKALARAHGPVYVSNLSTMMYFLYLYLTRTTLDIFVCLPTEPDDGAPHGYMQPVFEPCYESGGVHLKLLPRAVITLLVYTVGYPVLIGWLMIKYRRLAEEDQLLRAMGTGDTKRTNPNAYNFRRAFHRLYYMYKPHKTYWVLAILFRKFGVAVTALLFLKNPAFQLSMALLILFISYTLQVRNRPFMSMSEMEAVVKKYREKQEKAAGKKGRKGKGDALDELMKREASFKHKQAHRGIRLGEDDSTPLRARASRHIFNLNTVESTLLGSSVFVCLAGIMFESGRFDLAEFAAQRDALTIAVMLLIMCSLVYAVTVLVHDVVVTLKPDACQCCGTKKDKKRFKRRKLAEAPEVKSANQTHIEQNPLFDKRVAGALDGTSLPPSSPTMEQWTQIRAQYAKLVASRNKLQAASGGSESGGGAGASRGRRRSSVLLNPIRAFKEARERRRTDRAMPAVVEEEEESAHLPSAVSAPAPSLLHTSLADNPPVPVVPGVPTSPASAAGTGIHGDTTSPRSAASGSMSPGRRQSKLSVRSRRFSQLSPTLPPAQ